MTTLTLNTPLIWSIEFYQRFISPYKGFRCAHAALHQGQSCSQAVKHIILQHGIWRGRPLIKQRFADCKAAYVHLQAEQNQRRNKWQDWAGDCGLDCGCSLLDCDVIGCDISPC
jgi:putative component of membrane protein insertase Oxa1/YidC/SpoIIIJ protein YidD